MRINISITLSPEIETILQLVPKLYVIYPSSNVYAHRGSKTAITIHCFFLMMTLHPDVQKKAQAEIDAVCGRDRLPHYGDREHLPYLHAVIKEVIRTHPAVPAGEFQRTTPDARGSHAHCSQAFRIPQPRTMSMTVTLYQKAAMYSPTYGVLSLNHACSF